MKIILLSEDAVRIEPAAGMMTVEASSPEHSFTPFQMVASGLALCTYSVLQSWANHAKLEADTLAIEVRWDYVEEPHRAGRYEVTLDWPSLPEGRHKAAARVAGLCPVKHTLMRAPEIVTNVRASGSASASGANATSTQSANAKPTQSANAKATFSATVH